MSVLVKNGTIVTATDEYVADLYIQDEKIAAIGRDLDVEADQIIDATGKYVMPGGVDQHTHFEALCTIGEGVTAPYETTKAALVGGTTTIVDYVPQEPGQGLIDSAMYRMHKRAEGHAYVDFALHALITEVRESVFDEISKLPEIGISTIKGFMAYKGSHLYIDDGSLYRMMVEAKKVGVTVFVHAESADLTEMLRVKAVAEGKLSPRYHIETRPPLVETEATRRAVFLAEETGAPTLVVHVTTKGARDAIAEAKSRHAHVFGETCTHYLTVTKDKLYNDDFQEAAKYVCSPALRDEDDLAAMWEGVQNGTFSAIASDHCGIDLHELKQAGRDDFTLIPNGSPGAADRVPVVWTKGVVSGKISRQKFVEVISTLPAKINGIYPQKGAITVGADADIMIFDPAYRGQISLDENPNGVDYNIYEGMEIQGRPDTVLLRGKVEVVGGRYVGHEAGGQFVPAKPFGFCYGDGAAK